jgi:energy-converting hydrogenase Eha subunit H
MAMNLGVSLGEFIAFMTVFVVPAVVVIYIANRFFRLRERKLEIEAMSAAEKAAQYASRTSEIEERLRVVEQIVTDGGVHTAAQIEALRPPPRVGSKRKTAAVAKD